MFDEEFALDQRGLRSVNPRTIAACREACAACALACDACADACLGEADVGELRHAIRVDLHCADICLCASRLLARSIDLDPRLLRAQILACARACAACAEECRRHERHHAHCKLCAQACRLCAERCGALLRELPDTHGETHVRPHAANIGDANDTLWSGLLGQAR
jgi:hypothetical protein